MLGYMHNEFRRVIGIDANQNYIMKPDDCNAITFKDPDDTYKSTKTMFKADDLAKDICIRFYLPTYVDRVIFRSGNPEAVSKDVLFAFLKNANLDHPETYDMTSRLRPSRNCIELLLGNKGPGEKVSKLNIQTLTADGNRKWNKSKYRCSHILWPPRRPRAY